MTNNNNQNGGFAPPKEWKLNIPKTATVSYYYPEGETNISSLIQDGAYISEKLSEVNPSYGPVERFCSLIISCPSCSNDNITRWSHATDDGSAEISNEARIRCSYCYHTSHIKNWLFACSQHRGEYKATNQTSFTRAVLIAMNNKRVDSTLMTEMLTYLENNTW